MMLRCWHVGDLARKLLRGDRLGRERSSQRSRRKASAASPRAIRWSSRSPRVPRVCRRKTFARFEQSLPSVEAGPGAPGPFRFRSLYFDMTRTALGLLALLHARALAAQAPAPLY